MTALITLAALIGYLLIGLGLAWICGSLRDPRARPQELQLILVFWPVFVLVGLFLITAAGLRRILE